MRIIVWATLGLLLALPGRAAADQIINIQVLNSTLTFGFIDPWHTGWDVEGPYVNGTATTNWDYWGTTYDAMAGPLVTQTIVRDASASVLSSEYLYRGGTFRIDFATDPFSPSVVGSFTAPIIELRVFVNEVNGHVVPTYLLGRGQFDLIVATALGLPRRTSGGSILADMGLADEAWYPGLGGNYNSTQREAQDGATWIELRAVPEPSLLLLGILGVSACWARRKLTSARHPR